METTLKPRPNASCPHELVQGQPVEPPQNLRESANRLVCNARVLNQNINSAALLIFGLESEPVGTATSEYSICTAIEEALVQLKEANDNLARLIGAL